MQRISFKSTPLPLFIFVELLYACLFFLSLFSGLYLYRNVPVEVFWIAIPLELILMGFSLFIICMQAWQQLSTYVIFGNTIKANTPFTEKRAAKITYWGHAFHGRNMMLFFCTATKDQLLSYMHTHQELCIRFFGEKAVTELLQSEDGQIRLALTLFVRQHKDEIYVLKYHYRDKITQVQDAVGILPTNI